MRFVEFLSSDEELVYINPDNVESVRETSNDWIIESRQYGGPHTDIRSVSGQVTPVRESVAGTLEKLRYGDNNGKNF